MCIHLGGLGFALQYLARYFPPLATHIARPPRTQGQPSRPAMAEHLGMTAPPIPKIQTRLGPPVGGAPLRPNPRPRISWLAPSLSSSSLPTDGLGPARVARNALPSPFSASSAGWRPAPPQGPRVPPPNYQVCSGLQPARYPRESSRWTTANDPHVESSAGFESAPPTAPMAASGDNGPTRPGRRGLPRPRPPRFPPRRKHTLFLALPSGLLVASEIMPASRVTLGIRPAASPVGP